MKEIHPTQQAYADGLKQGQEIERERVLAIIKDFRLDTESRTGYFRLMVDRVLKELTEEIGK